MATKKVHVRNTVSGRVEDVPEHYLTHPVLSRYLVEVDEDAKDAEPEMYQPKDAEGNEVGDDAKPVAKRGSRKTETSKAEASKADSSDVSTSDSDNR